MEQYITAMDGYGLRRVAGVYAIAAYDACCIMLLPTMAK